MPARFLYFLYISTLRRLYICPT
ncbi:hypothetical protein PSPO01_14939 [Paraphaeosphaeria sporulosa]